MGQSRQQSFCGVSKTVSPAYIDHRTGDESSFRDWGHVVDNGELEIIHSEGEEANIYDLKDKLLNVSDINSYQQFFFKLLNLKRNKMR